MNKDFKNIITGQIGRISGSERRRRGAEEKIDPCGQEKMIENKNVGRGGPLDQVVDMLENTN